MNTITKLTLSAALLIATAAYANDSASPVRRTRRLRRHGYDGWPTCPE